MSERDAVPTTRRGSRGCRVTSDISDLGLINLRCGYTARSRCQSRVRLTSSVTDCRWTFTDGFMVLKFRLIHKRMSSCQSKCVVLLLENLEIQSVPLLIREVVEEGRTIEERFVEHTKLEKGEMTG